MKRFLAAFAIACITLSAAPAMAQDADLPYWASIRASEVNMRVGPAESYKIDWVYRRTGLPMKVVRRQEGWRLVEDPDGTSGWILARFLSRDRTAIVTGTGDAEMRDSAEAPSRLLWRIEPGVTGKLGDCDAGWCSFDVNGRRGFVRQGRLWGAGEP
jgi:SH3-like domain-containing protein